LSYTKGLKKQMEDGLSHFHLMNYRARAVIAVTTEVVRQAQRRHNLDPLTTIALGRALSAISLLASTLKHPKEYVHGVFSGDGPLKKIVAECNGNGECRGYSIPSQIIKTVKSQAQIPDTIGKALGNGNVSITRGKYGEMQHYSAVVELLNGEIASDVARFLTESEQIPSAVAAGVKLSSNGEVLAAGGMLVQRLGGATLTEEELLFIEEKMSSMHVSESIFNNEKPDNLVQELQIENQVWGLLTHRKLSFQCSCSREKMAMTAMSLGEKELRDIVKEVGKIEMNCSYCSSSHQFTLDDLIRH
jgi:molecular chaperone Hsp33